MVDREICEQLERKVHHAGETRSFASLADCGNLVLRQETDSFHWRSTPKIENGMRVANATWLGN